MHVLFWYQKCYEGEPDPVAFENWLSLLLGVFRTHQLDVLNQGQDHVCLGLLGQARTERLISTSRSDLGVPLSVG